MRHSFGRGEKSAGCENVEIRLVAGVWRKTCGLLLRKEITPSEGVGKMQECGTPSEGVKNLQAAETSKYVL